MKHKIKNSFIIGLILISFAFGWQMSSYYEGGKYIGGTEGEEYKNNFNFKQFYQVYGILKHNYLYQEKLIIPKLTYGAIKGMVEALGDDYTAFLDPEETSAFLTNLDGELEGIGVEIEDQGGKIIIITPLKESPAEKAGVLPSDIVIKVNDENIEGMSIYEVVSKIKGPKGTTVNITFYRESIKDTYSVDIIRDKINIDSVRLTIEEGNIAHINLFSFNPNTKTQFDDIVQKLLLEKPNGIVLDLRFNGGGYLDTSIDILQEFANKNTNVVSIIYKENSRNEYRKTRFQPRLKGIPLVVLINQGSASASEIVAGAIQDLNLGLVIGAQSFGKGTVQEVLELNNRASLRYTIAKWLTPNGRNVSKVGITPDKVIEIDIESLDEEGKVIDNQLKAALEYLNQ